MGAPPVEGSLTVSGSVACVVDHDVLLHAQVLRWFSSLHVLAGVKPTDLVLVTIDGVRSVIVDYLSSVGVPVLDARHFDSRSTTA